MSYDPNCESVIFLHLINWVSDKIRARKDGSTKQAKRREGRKEGGWMTEFHCARSCELATFLHLVHEVSQVMISE